MTHNTRPIHTQFTHKRPWGKVGDLHESDIADAYSQWGEINLGTPIPDGTRPSKTPARASAAVIAEKDTIPKPATHKMFSTGGRRLRNSPETIPPTSQFHPRASSPPSRDMVPISPSPPPKKEFQKNHPDQKHGVYVGHTRVRPFENRLEILMIKFSLIPFCTVTVCV